MIPENSKSFAIYRFPDQQEIHVIAETEGKVVHGFQVAPFDSHLHAQFLIHADFSSLMSLEDFNQATIDVELFHLKKTINGGFSSQEEYVNQVVESLKSIEHEGLSKLVLSRRIQSKFVSPKEIKQAFSKLCEQHKSAFVFCFSHPNSGTWLGASPELLLDSKQNKHNTMALAGTLPNSMEKAWSEKEILEQSLVTDYIVGKLKWLKVQNLELKGPMDKAAGAIKHLCTDISFESETSSNEIAGTLHPTPAVAGIPLEKAIEAIKRIETYDREYYTGFCGPVDLNQNSKFFVNLRSAQFCEEGSIIYCGGGILKNSDPKSEWIETVRKSETVLGALEKM